MKVIPVFFVVVLLAMNASFAQHGPGFSNGLKYQLEEVIKPYRATIGIAVIDIEAHDTLTINNHHHYPMLSVYKFPLALAVLHQVDQGKITLQQKVHIGKSELKPGTWSPLQVKFPEGNIEITIAELLDYTVSQSDNNACDILFKLVGGTKKVNQYIHGLGISNISIAATEEEMGKAWEVQYTNWTEPFAMSRLLEGLAGRKYLSDSCNAFLMKLLIQSANSPKRLKGLLPGSMVVAHKTGTSNTNASGIMAAVNDIGIITLPGGNHIAISVFISDSREKFETNEKIIAEISKTTVEYFSNTKSVFFEKGLIVSDHNDTLPYRLLAPLNAAASKKYPLLVYLHGSGSRGNDNETPVLKLSKEFTDSLHRINYPCYILVPQCPAKDVWVNFPGFDRSLAATDTPTIAAKQTLKLIHQLIKAKNIDGSRIYLTGYSMGGEGTFDLLTREPDLFACAVPLASVADTSKADLVKHIPIWAFHGGDDQVNDVKYSRMMIDAIKKAGGSPRYTEVANTQHDCRDAAYANPGLWKWMFEQRKK